MKNEELKMKTVVFYRNFLALLYDKSKNSLVVSSF